MLLIKTGTTKNPLTKLEIVKITRYQNSEFINTLMMVVTTYMYLYTKICKYINRTVANEAMSHSCIQYIYMPRGLQTGLCLS